VTAEQMIRMLENVPGDTQVVFTEAHGVGMLQVWESWVDRVTIPDHPKVMISLAAKS